MVGGFFMIFIVLALLVLTVTDAVALFWPWIIAVVVACILLSLIVKLVKYLAIQIVLTYLATIVAAVLMVVSLPLHLTTLSCIVLVSFALWGSGATMCANKKMRVWGKIASFQVLWMAPLTMTFYVYNFVNPGEIVAPLLVAVIGMIAAIVIGGQN